MRSIFNNHLELLLEDLALIGFFRHLGQCRSTQFEDRSKRDYHYLTCVVEIMAAQWIHQRRAGRRVDTSEWITRVESVVDSKGDLFKRVVYERRTPNCNVPTKLNGHRCILASMTTWPELWLPVACSRLDPAACRQDSNAIETCSDTIVLSLEPWELVACCWVEQELFVRGSIAWESRT